MRIVLLPGLDGTGLLFEPFLAEVPSDVEVSVIAYPQDLSSVEDLSEYVLSQLVEPCLLVAESYSGPIALAVAKKRADLVVGLVLCATFVSSPNSIVLTMCALIPARLMKMSGAIRPLVNFVCFGGAASKELLTKFASILKGLRAETIKKRLKVLAGLEGAMVSIHVPVLILRAKHDLLVLPKASRALTLTVPAKVIEIDGPHFLMQVKPQLCWREIEAFRTAMILKSADLSLMPFS